MTGAKERGGTKKMLGPGLEEAVIHVQSGLYGGYYEGAFNFVVKDALGDTIGVLPVPAEGGKRAAFAAAREYFVKKFLANPRFLAIERAHVYRASGVLECGLIDKRRVKPGLLYALECPWESKKGS
jgi:hypothetical protein